MLDVFFTVDVEIWCDSWKNIDAEFPRAFQQYVYGKTNKGEYGLRFQLKRLQEFGLKAVFFVEPLFATRFGLAPLAEIVGLIKEYGQEVQLHMHTEWVSESLQPLIKNATNKRQFLHYFSLEEQTTLIAAGLQLIQQADGGSVNAFRAGSFGFNRDTLRAASANGLRFDSSYNATLFGAKSGVSPGHLLFEPVATEGLIEYPMTVFNDGTGRLRHAQLGACSSLEMEGLLWQALEQRRKAFVILSHNFELLTPSKRRHDPVVLKRFERLCHFLTIHNDQFRTCGFQNLEPQVVSMQQVALSSPLWKAGHRMAKQLSRRMYRFG